jgi:hypothetical protein
MKRPISLYVGQEVRHVDVPEWGNGVVLETSANRAIISFELGGTRKLDLNFAQLAEVHSVVVGAFSLPLFPNGDGGKLASVIVKGGGKRG